MTTDPDKPYWVAFNHINGIGTVRTGQLLQRFGTLRDACSPLDIKLALKSDVGRIYSSKSV